jgi:hypothetical protein
MTENRSVLRLASILDARTCPGIPLNAQKTKNLRDSSEPMHGNSGIAALKKRSIKLGRAGHRPSADLSKPEDSKYYTTPVGREGVMKQSAIDQL